MSFEGTQACLEIILRPRVMKPLLHNESVLMPIHMIVKKTSMNKDLFENTMTVLKTFGDAATNSFSIGDLLYCVQVISNFGNEHYSGMCLVLEIKKKEEEIVSECKVRFNNGTIQNLKILSKEYSNFEVRHYSDETRANYFCLYSL